MSSTLTAVGLVFGTLFTVGAVVRGAGTWLRRRRIAAITAPTRAAYGVRVRAQVDGSAVLPGMQPSKNNITTADLAVDAERFLLASQRGLLVDVGTGHGRPLLSARCTGPERLVLEGTTPRLSGPPGHFRLEMVLDDAAAWAEALRPFVARSVA